MTLLKDIQNAKYIVIEFDSKYLASASALYTYILQLHKKVSLLCVKKIDNKFSCIPWFDKVKNSGYSSADLKVDLSITAIDLYMLFEKNNIKLNQKMATALYAGLLLETKGFQNTNVNGMIFAVAKQLVDAKAEHKLCTNYILNTKSLAYLRLKALVLKKMLLNEDATVVVMNIDEDDLKKSGAKLEDAFEILEDGLTLPYVVEAILQNNNKILKRIKKEI